MSYIKIFALILLLLYLYCIYFYKSISSNCIKEGFAGFLPIIEDKTNSNNDGELDLYNFESVSDSIIEEEQMLINNSNLIDKYKITIIDNFPNNKKINCFLMNKKNRKYMTITGTLEDKIKIKNINDIHIGDIKNKLYNNYQLNINDKEFEIYVSHSNNQINMDISDEENNNILLYLIKDTEDNEFEDKYNIFFNYKNVGAVYIEEKTIYVEMTFEYKKYINFAAFMYILLNKINSF